MFYPDQDARRQFATEKVERLADDYAKASGFAIRRRTSVGMPVETVLRLARRARRWATALQPET